MARVNPPPTPEQFANTWTRAYAASVRGASTDGERITRSKAEGMAGATGMASLYADNVLIELDDRDQSSISIDKLLASGHARTLSEAQKVAGANGLVSITEGSRLPADLKDDFLALRGQPVPRGAERLANRFEQLASGLMYSSESDYPYAAFSTRFSKDSRLTAASFREAMQLPESVEISVKSTREFFADHKNTEYVSENDVPAYAALERAMKATLSDLKFIMVGGEDVVEGQVYIAGRTKSGDLAGLSTTRIWT
ncbi:MAG: hypothetical protein HYV07_26830 [Deltaproteobacteria bacterium]|nr:hypothetical protein [Deltaproteobacteria bacterium]